MDGTKYPIEGSTKSKTWQQLEGTAEAVKLADEEIKALGIDVDGDGQITKLEMQLQYWWKKLDTSEPSSSFFWLLLLWSCMLMQS